MKELTHSLPIVLVGAGNLATHLGKALKQAGYTIVQVYSRTNESATQLAELLQAEPVTEIDGLTTEAGLYIVALKDAVLPELIPSLLKGREESLWVHTAGSIPMNIWEEHGADRYGVFYPMQTFSKQRDVCFSEIPLFVEARCADDVCLLKEVAGELTNHVYEADSEQRRSLHLAAVFCSNFAKHMYALSAGLLEKYNLPFSSMLSLIDETARKVHQLDPRQAQTGPAVRNDVNVMEKHLQMLADEPHLQSLYKALSESIHQMARSSSSEPASRKS